LSNKLGNGNEKKRFSKGDAVVIFILVLVVGIIAYSVTKPPSPPPSTSATSATSNSTMESSMSHIPLQATDFNITNNNGCAYTDQTTGKTVARFYLTITNRFNESFQLINASLVATVRLANGSRINIPEKRVSAGSVPYTNSVSFTVYVGVAGTGFEHGRATVVLLIVTAYVQETNEPITRPLTIPIPTIMANC